MIVLIGIFRIHLTHPLVEIKKDRVQEFHNNENFANEIFNKSSGFPVVANSYQDASILSFYNKENIIVPSLNVNSRSNQFNIWQLDSLYQGDTVMFANKFIESEIPIKRLQIDKFYLSKINNLPRTTGFKLKVNNVKKKGGKLYFDVAIESPKNEDDLNDKSVISLHITNSDNKTRFPRKQLQPDKGTISIDIYPKDKTITIYLMSKKMKGLIRAYDKIDLSKY